MKIFKQKQYTRKDREAIRQLMIHTKGLRKSPDGFVGLSGRSRIKAQELAKEYDSKGFLGMLKDNTREVGSILKEAGLDKTSGDLDHLVKKATDQRLIERAKKIKSIREHKKRYELQNQIDKTYQRGKDYIKKKDNQADRIKNLIYDNEALSDTEFKSRLKKVSDIEKGLIDRSKRSTEKKIDKLSAKSLKEFEKRLKRQWQEIKDKQEIYDRLERNIESGRKSSFDKSIKSLGARDTELSKKVDDQIVKERHQARLIKDRTLGDESYSPGSNEIHVSESSSPWSKLHENKHAGDNKKNLGIDYKGAGKVVLEARASSGAISKGRQLGATSEQIREGSKELKDAFDTYWGGLTQDAINNIRRG